MAFIYRGKRVLRVGLFGFGRSNAGVASYLSKKYPNLTFTLRESAGRRDCPFGRFERILYGTAALKEIDEDLLFLSPSVRRDKRELAEAARRGVMLSSDAEFFFDGYEGESFAVSGSDGKSTTTTLTSLLLSGEGERVPAIGNIGAAMTPWLDRGASRVAIELSSFQLMSACPITTRALITNISPNHLDWHRSFGEYISAKENLLRYANERVFNLDCELSRGIMAHYPADVVFSVKLDEDKIRAEAGSRTAVYLKEGGIYKDGEHLINVCEVANRTAHGINNLVAAIALTHGYVTRERIREVAGAFHGLSHRCEEVGVFDGIRYLNSSIDSTPKRTITTLSSLDGKPIVIIGGRSKGLGYAQLIPHLKSHASLAVLTGETGREVAGLLKDSDLPYRYEPRFDDAVEYAIRHASCGDTVLLSPASTSFDSFSCFEERGNRFKEIIRKFYYKGF